MRRESVWLSKEESPLKLPRQSKIMAMREAIRQLHDGDVIVIEGFTHLICFAAAHEIIRQQRRDLTVCRLTPDLIYDQLIGAGCVRRLVFSWAGKLERARSMLCVELLNKVFLTRSNWKSILIMAWSGV
jgi:acyl CoA:acetate/3-ketoacid CoA transferase alpha subunit